jgi:lipopolysaccharide transport system ATP-binding protein
MGDVASEGRTVLFVSHNMVAVQNLCPKTILLGQGKFIRMGDSESIVSDYLSIPRQSNEFNPNYGERLGTKRIQILNLRMYPTRPMTGKPLQFLLDVSLSQDEIAIEADYSISIKTDHGINALQLHSGHVVNGIKIKPGISSITADIDSLFLSPGKYTISLWVGSGKTTYDWIPEAYTFEISMGSFTKGILIENRGYPVILPSNWRVLNS